MTGTFMDWISQHYEGLILVIWAIMTIALFVEILIKVTREEDAKREAEKLTYKEEKDESAIR